MGYFNIYGQYVYDNNELYHHGVERQEWGVRNGPPYPLRPGQASAAEVSAGWKSAVADAKDDYKKKKQAYKKAKLDYKAGRVTTATERWMLKKAKRSIEGSKEGLQQIRDAGGDKRLEAAAKADIKYFTRAYKEAKARLSAQKASKPVLKMTLEEAKKEFDLAKEKLKVEKQLAGVDFKSRAQRILDAVSGKNTTLSEIDYDGGAVIIDKATKNLKTGKIEDPRSHREASYALSYADKINEEKDWKKRNDVVQRLNQESVDAMFDGDYRKAAMLHVASHKIKDFEGKSMTPREASMLLKYRATSRELDLANFDRRPTGNKKADQETRDLVNNELDRIKHERKVAEEIDKLYGTSKEYGKETKYVKDINEYIHRQTPYINEHLYGIKNKMVDGNRSASKTDRQSTIDYNTRFTKFEKLSEKEKRAFITKDLNNDMDGLMSLAKKHNIPANKDQMHDVVTSSPSYARALQRSGMTYKEIAEKIGISESSAYNLLNS